MLVVFTSDATQTGAGFDANYTITGGNNFCSTATVTDDFTVIEDGSGNSNYYNSTLCTWLIQPPNAQGIDLYFTAFDLESASPDGQTIYDAVEIYDGIDENAPLIATYFGSNIPPVTSSTGGSMFIKFYSDASVNFAGWEAYFVTQTQNYCQGNTDIIASPLTGTISDGSATDDYGNGSECTWTLQATPPENVMLTFNEFDTEANFDFVIVYDGIDDTAPVLGSYSGTNLPPQVVSSGTDMFVVFVSDESVVAGGFEANYEMLFVSTDALIEQYELAVFPNPFTNQLTVEFDLEKAENVQIEVLDVLGRRVYQEDLGQRTSGENQHFINTNDLTKGAYILKLKIGEQEINQKVIKLK